MKRLLHNELNDSRNLFPCRWIFGRFISYLETLTFTLAILFTIILESIYFIVEHADYKPWLL